jgi:hypothetical protein
MNVTSRTPVLQPRLPKKRTESECGLVPCRDLFSTYSSRARSFFPQTAARPRRYHPHPHGGISELYQCIHFFARGPLKAHIRCSMSLL